MLDWMREHQAEDIAQEMKATKPWIEATREVLGLVIVIAVLLANYFYAKRRVSRSGN
jgi:heme A synthase